MKFPGLHSDSDADRPVAHASWHKTLFQEHNQLRLKVEGTRIVTEVSEFGLCLYFFCIFCVHVWVSSPIDSLVDDHQYCE